MATFASDELRMANNESQARQSSIVLIGFMGSGKSSVGRRLATRLNLPFVDLDSEIVSAAGMSIPRIFASQGEERFRQIETEVLRDALKRSAVMASGGGLVTQQANREILKDGAEHGLRVVYLRGQPETLAKRIRRQPGTRPLIDQQSAPLDFQSTKRRVQELLAQRAPWYEECATLTLDTDDFSTARVVEEIVARLQTHDDSQ
jgi:shikimate kinase